LSLCDSNSRTAGPLIGLEVQPRGQFSPIVTERQEQLALESGATIKYDGLGDHLPLPYSRDETCARGSPLVWTFRIQQFLGHAKLETTQVYAESTTAMIKKSYQKALAR
jgi:hypothetical protein